MTVSALIANGQVAQIPYHLNRRLMGYGLNPDAGRGGGHATGLLNPLVLLNAFSALPVVKDVLETFTLAVQGSTLSGVVAETCLT